MVSVIIPIYNAEPYLRRCLDSVLSSTYREFELILVNDGSTDSSPAICEGYAARDSRVTLISQENRGASAARNRGLEVCRGEWVVFVDADDLISPDFLGLVAREEYQDQDLLLFDFARTEEELIAPHPAPETRRFGPEDVPELLRCLLGRRQLAEDGNLNLLSPCGKAYRRALLMQHAIRFDTGLPYGEDQVFNAEYLTRTVLCAYLPVPVYYYNIRSSSSSHRFNPRLPDALTALLDKIQAILEAGHLFSAVEKEFYFNALQNLSYILVWSVFSPDSTNSPHKRIQLCRMLRENKFCDKAMAYRRTCDDWSSRIFLYLFYLRWYHMVGLLARLYNCYLLRKNRR